MKCLNSILVPVLGLVLAVGVLGPGCKPKGVLPQDAQAAELAAVVQRLPGASNVCEALERKEYDAVITALASIRGAASTDQEAVDSAYLSRHVKDKLMDAAPTDPKAAEALSAVRAMTLGR